MAKERQDSSLNWQMAATNITYNKYPLWIATLEELRITFETCQGYYLSLLLFKIILELLGHVLSKYKEKRVTIGNKLNYRYSYPL